MRTEFLAPRFDRFAVRRLNDLRVDIERVGMVAWLSDARRLRRP
jgi:hypothetical protein